MQAQLKQEDPVVDTYSRELDATKAELQICRAELESARSEIQLKTECVDVLNLYYNDTMKPQLEEAKSTATQLRGQVAALSTDLAKVKSTSRRRLTRRNV